MSKCLHVTYPLFLSDFNEYEFSRQIFDKVSNIKFHQNPSSESQVVPRGQTDMTKVIVAFRNFVNAPKHDHKSIMIVKIKTAQSEVTKFT
jgi:hypothetical protein